MTKVKFELLDIVIINQIIENLLWLFTFVDDGYFFFIFTITNWSQIILYDSYRVLHVSTFIFICNGLVVGDFALKCSSYGC